MAEETTETVTLTIDGQEAKVPKGTTVFEAARQLGIDIPHFCYHKHLSIAGVCRMCLVEIEKMPKLATSCSTVAGDGMVVSTGHSSERVATAVREVLELHFINHPIDCPICDQAGECKLQDYYYQWGLYLSRFNEKKVTNYKHKTIGPMVVLDADRCILCSRCVRFCREIAETEELCIANRGDHAEITVGPGKTLDNPYSANVVDICPVGAHTLRDFRFKCRAWYLTSTPSVCPGCARGCSVTVDHHKGRVFRLRPRDNADVNGPWMCDQGRLSYKRMYDGERLLKPMVRKRGTLGEASWEDAIEVAGKVLKEAGAETAALGSAHATNEENHLLLRLMEAAKSTKVALGYPWEEKGEEDELLRRRDLSTNRMGAMSLLGAVPLEAILPEAKALVVLMDNPLKGATAEADEAFHSVPSSVVLSTHLNETSMEATVALPVAAFAERGGTVTNFDGWTAVVQAAVPPAGEAKPAVEVLARLIAALGGKTTTDASALFSELAPKADIWKGLAYGDLGQLGARAPEPEPEPEPEAEGKEDAE